MVKEAIHFILVEILQGKTYDPEHIPEWTQLISDTIKNKLKGPLLKIQFILFNFLAFFYMHILPYYNDLIMFIICLFI